MGSAVSSICQARAPCPASACATVCPSQGFGRVPADPAQRVGGQQVLHRQLVFLGQRRDRAARGRQPRGGGRITLGPAMRRRRAVRHRPAGGLGQLRVGAGPRPRHRGQPVPLVPPGLPAGEAADPDQLGVIGRVGPGRLDDRRVGQDTARGQVGPLGDPVPGRPELTHHGEAPAGLHPVDAGRAPPGIRPGRGRAGGEHRRELLAGPLGFALGVEFVRKRVAQLGQHLHVEGRVAEQFLTQRTDRPVGRRMALLQVETEHLLDERAEGHPRVAEQPPG